MTSHVLVTEGLTSLNESSAAQTSATPFDDIDAVVATYEQRIFRFMLVSLRDRDAAQSLTQDTFLRAWISRASFRGDCAIFTWLMRIAINLLRDHTRTDRFRFWKRASANAVDVSDVAQHLPLSESSLESRLIASEQMTLIWDSVAQLSSRQRDIFLLRFVEDLCLSEIAEITHLPISTVKSHLYRALTTIRARHTDQKIKEAK
ncbi:RNA polymerase sigma factor [Edaphobacter bradus]|uniref:RNA polymerase sigma factor n=1 Tax=Edaphobacter bradus TaxID=2259016 RepID=UPI0021E043C2|nr:sigma-70 family RNA polymerase sigma factor [Edaphobacter bradus]